MIFLAPEIGTFFTFLAPETDYQVLCLLLKKGETD
jgi:hypothetical protein